MIRRKQCTRLNYECDYSPKLAFKDETPKVIDKYLGSNSPVDDWDRKGAWPRERRMLIELNSYR